MKSSASLAGKDSLPQDWLSYIDKYRDYLQFERGYSTHTLEAYLRDIHQYLGFIQSQTDFLHEVDRPLFRRYLTWLSRELKVEKRSQARKITALRSFYRFLSRKEILPNTTAESFSAPRHKTGLPKPLYPTDTGRLYQQMENKTAAAGDSLAGQPGDSPEQSLTEKYRLYRDAYLIDLLYNTGLRVGELCSLTLGHVSHGEKKFKVMGKGRRERYVFIGESCLALQKKYLTVREEFLRLKKKDFSALFLNLRPGPLTTRGVRFILNKWNQEKPITRGLHPHRLRHTFATDLINNGADIRSVQELLGHASLSTTQKYTEVSRERLRNVYMHAHPHARLRRKTKPD